jgi:hypothetical protein
MYPPGTTTCSDIHICVRLTEGCGVQATNEEEESTVDFHDSEEEGCLVLKMSSDPQLIHGSTLFRQSRQLENTVNADVDFVLQHLSQGRTADFSPVVIVV